MDESLIPWQDLQAARAEYELAHPVGPTRAEILCEIVRENPLQTAKDLALAVTQERCTLPEEVLVGSRARLPIAYRFAA